MAIAVNGWHAVFHLLPGLVGIAAARRPGAALGYALAAGGGYILMGVWGLLAGGGSVGLIAVDTSGDLVHVIEGLIPFTAGIVTLAAGHSERRRPCRIAPACLTRGMTGNSSADWIASMARISSVRSPYSSAALRHTTDAETS